MTTILSYTRSHFFFGEVGGQFNKYRFSVRRFIFYYFTYFYTSFQSSNQFFVLFLRNTTMRLKFLFFQLKFRFLRVLEKNAFLTQSYANNETSFSFIRIQRTCLTRRLCLFDVRIKRCQFCRKEPRRINISIHFLFPAC